jgi:general secretion pathway protein D
MKLPILFYLCAVLTLPSLFAETRVQSVFSRGMPLRDFAELITRASGAEVNIVVSREAAEIPVRVFIAESSVEELIRAVCASHGLWYRVTGNGRFLQIMTLEEYRQGVNLYTEETVEVLPILYPPPSEIGDTLARLFQDRVVWDPPQEDLKDELDRMKRALDRMDSLGDRATLVQGGRTGTGGLGRDDQIFRRDDRRLREREFRDDRVRTTRDGFGDQNLDEVAERQEREAALLRETIRPARDFTDEESRRPGLVYVSASPAANALIFRSSDPVSLERVKSVAQQLDRPRAQVLLEVRVLDLRLGTELTSGVDWLFQDGPDNQPNKRSGGMSRGITATPGGLIQSSDPVSLLPQGTGIDPLAAVFSVVTENVRARIQLLEEENRVRTLATPSLMVSDNEASRVFIGSEVTVLERVAPRIDFVGTENPVPTFTFEVDSPRRRIGSTLLITPKIHADGTVTIRLLQEDTRLGPQRVIRFGQTEADQFTAQDVEERSVTTTVLTRTGDTVAIGGLIREHSEVQESGVPVLRSLPLLGRAFQRSRDVTERSELIVLIRPTVILTPDQAQPASEAFLQRNSTSENLLGP